MTEMITMILKNIYQRAYLRRHMTPRAWDRGRGQKGIQSAPMITCDRPIRSCGCALTINTKIEPPYLLMAESTKMILYFAMLDDPDDMDSVEVSSNASVASLRLLLKSQNGNTFRDIDALNIKLWQVGTFSVCGYVVAYFVHLIATKFLVNDSNEKPS
jgi:hypothetical protein